MRSLKGFQGLRPLMLMAALATAQTEDYSTWANFRVFGINTSSSGGGANMTGTVTRFPLLLRLNASNAADVFAEAKPGGADLRFRREPPVPPPVLALAKGSVTAAVQALDDPLPYEIERWDSTARIAEIWVLLDTIYGNRQSDVQRIAMHWGKPDAPARSNPAAVFDTANGFMAVWHMGGVAPAANRANAVPGGNPAIPSGAGVAGGFPARAGVIGRADTLRGGTEAAQAANDDHFNLGSGYADFSGGMTMSAWIKPAAPSHTLWSVFLGLGNGAPGDNLTIGRMGSTQKLFAQAYNGTTDGGRTESSLLTNDQWQLVTFTALGNEQALHHNGMQSISSRTTPITLPSVSRSMAYLGRSLFASDANPAGMFDEVRLHKVARSDDWIQLEYENQKPGSAVITVIAPPAAPTLTSPAINATGVPLYTDLTWSYTTGRYRVQLALDSLFTVPILDAVEVSANRAIGPLSAGTVYYWRARSQSMVGTGAYSPGTGPWSGIRRFTTEPPATGIPPAPLLRSPIAFSMRPLSTGVAWYAAAGASSYHLQVATVPSFASSVVNDSGITGLERTLGPLQGSTEHYWRVRGKNGFGAGPWSEVRAFTTVASVPAIPTLLAPAAFATVSTIPTLSWEPAAGAATYRVQVSLVPDFATAVLNDSTVTGTSRAIGQPNGTGQLAGFTDHYWRVNAKNSAGTSAWSTIRRFTTGEPVNVASGGSQGSHGAFLTQVRMGDREYLRFELARDEPVTVRLFDAAGSRQVLWDGTLSSGRHRLELPAHPGVRFVEFQASSRRRVLPVRP